MQMNEPESIQAPRSLSLARFYKFSLSEATTGSLPLHQPTNQHISHTFVLALFVYIKYIKRECPHRDMQAASLLARYYAQCHLLFHHANASFRCQQPTDLYIIGVLSRAALFSSHSATLILMQIM